MKNHKAFTLVELLVVIGIVGILLAITLVAINPSRQFAQANNRKRQSDVTTILNAITQYGVDRKGEYPSIISSTPQFLANTGADLCSLLVPDYVAALPTDPQLGGGVTISNCTASYNTYYQVQLEAGGRITVIAPGTELGEALITATR
ncbi:MAG: type II secretion system protein [Patescibacteria group bacterium]